MAEITVSRKHPVPAGLQRILNRLAKLALSNSPCCLYECFAIALESDIDWRTLIELQLAPYTQKILQVRGDTVYNSVTSGESASKHETSEDELAAHCHELGDANEGTLQSADVCQELVAVEHLTLTSEDHMHCDGTSESAVLDELMHPAAVPDNMTEQKDSLTSDVHDVDFSYSSLASSGHSVSEDQLGQNSSAEFSGRQFFSETSQDQDSHDDVKTEEVDAAVELCTVDITEDTIQLDTFEQLMKEDSGGNEVETGLLEIDQGDTINTDGLSTVHPSRSNYYETVFLLDSGYPSESGGENCETDDRCLAEDNMTDKAQDADCTWHTSAVSLHSELEQTSSVVQDPEVRHPDSENSRFADIPVDSRTLRVRLTPDWSEEDVICSNADQVAQDQISSPVSHILDKTEYPSAVEFWHISDCINAGVFASLDGMDLRDDMELLPVDSRNNGSEDISREDAGATYSMNDYVDSIKSITSLGNNSQCLNSCMYASLGGMELCNDMELIPVDDAKTDREHSMDASLDRMELCNDMEIAPVDDAKTGKENSMDASLDGMELCNDMELAPVDDAKTLREHSMDASLDGMELCNDMELAPVDDANTGREHSVDATEVISDSKKTVSLSSDIYSQITDDKSERLEFSQLITNALEITETASTPEHLENVPKDDTDIQVLQHDVELIDDQASDDENERSESSHFITDSLEMTNTASASDNEEQLENVSKDNTGVDVVQHDVEIINKSDAFSVDDYHVELSQPSNSDINLLITQEHAQTSDQMLQYTDARDDVGQEKSYYNVVIAAEEVCSSRDENSEPTDDVGRTSVVLLYSSDSVDEVQNDDVRVLSETIHRDTAATGLTEMTDSAVSSYAPEMADTRKTKSLWVMENGEDENTTGCASTVHTARSATTDLEFYTDAGFMETENSITEQHTDSSLLNNKESASNVCYAYQECPFSDEQSEEQLELFTVDDACLQPQRLELDDLTLTVTCYIPEETEELLDDAVEDVNEEDTYFEAPSLPSSGKLTAIDPVMSSGLAHYIDQNAASADIILPRRRSSDFMLSYLMPIDETAEFTDSANTDDDLASNKSHLLQPDVNLNDTKTEPNSNDEQKMACDINASPSVEHAHHELRENNQQGVAAVSGVEEHGLDSVYDIGVSAVLDDGHKMKSSDNEQQKRFEESHSSVEDPVERNDGSVSDRHSSTGWFTANQQAAGTNRYISEVYIDVVARNSKAATNVAQVSHLHDDNNAHATTAEHTMLTMNFPLQACSEDNDEMFMSLAADATQHSLSSNSLKKSAGSSISDFGDEHLLEIHSVKQNRVKHLDNQNNETVDLDMEIYSSAVATFTENLTTTQIPDLKYNNEPSKQNVETALQLCERPVLQSTDIQTALETILQGFANNAHETAEDNQQTIVEERRLSQIATNDTGAFHSCASVPGVSSLLVTKASGEFEEPAEDSATDFESTLEYLHRSESSAHADD